MAPTIPKVIGVKVPLANVGEYVIVRNITTGQEISQKLGSDKGTVVNPSDEFTWAEVDTIQAEMHGRLQGFGTKKISSGGADFTLNLSTDTLTPGLTL